MKILPILAFALCLSLLLPPTVAHSDDWHYQAGIDLSYVNAFQSDDALNWRSKATTQRLNQFAPNMGMFAIQKTATAASRWGLEIGAQAGYDTDGQVPAEQRLAGYSLLRYLSRANVSYLAPLGKGLTLTAGLMNSFIGFESPFAKDNPNYTRSWMADYSPYYLLGIGAQYPLNDRLLLGFYLLSDYDYLAYRNDKLKYGWQIAWQIDPHWKLSQNLFAGPEQSNGDSQFWRYFSDTQLQWSNDELMLALAYDIGTEKLQTGTQLQTLWMGAALFSRWHIGGPWSVALRPEVYWDPDGRMTGNQQLIKAVTATLEYKIPLPLHTNLAIRGEYRYDESTGRQGGFFKTGSGSELVGDQHLILFSCLLSLDQP